MDNKGIADLILTLEKSIIKDYSVSLTEASNSNFQDRINTLFDMSLRSHRELFDLMYSKGWYQLEEANQNKTNQEKNKLQQELNSLENNSI